MDHEPFAATAETHSGVVFFLGDRAYKLKKPVQFGFLDFRRRETRRAVCEREVELNRRLSPDVYLGVADVSGPDGEPLDHLVVMRRLPSDRRLSALAETGAGLDGQTRRLARLLAAFHSRAERAPEIDDAAGADALDARWEANAAEMARFVDDVLDSETCEAVARLAHRYIDGRRPLFDARVAAGRACDGHGDLLAEDIFLLEDGPRVLDCLEFDDHLRWGDGLADVAFLAMDLDHLGRPDLATVLLDAYGEFAGDIWPSSLAHHHIAHRAQIRAKVACLRLEQGDPDARDVAGRLLALCHRHLVDGQVRLIVIGGLPGSGKSTLAAHLAPALDAVVIRSDEVRKQGVGLDVSDPATAGVGEGIYRQELTDRAYQELLRRAQLCLAHGQSVILDASWHSVRWREEARGLADQAPAELAELRCVAPLEDLERRAVTRAAAGGDPSDATPAVIRAMAARQSPWPTAIMVDTAGPRSAASRQAFDAIVRSP